MTDTEQDVIKNLISNKKPTPNNVLVILVGLPYSGKSTLAQKISDYNFIHIWSTKIKKQYNLNDEQFLYLAERIIETLLVQGYNVIFDFLNHKELQRNKISSLAIKNNKNYFVAYLNTSKDIILQRQLKVVEHSGRTNISKEIIEEISSEFEKPRGEKVFEIINDSDFRKFLDLIKN